MAGSDDEARASPWLGVRAAVLGVVAGLPDGVADVTEASEEESLSIAPTRPKAPTVYVANAVQHEILCDIAGTHFWIWDEDDEALSAEVARVVDNVVRHGFVQAGETGRVPLDDGHIGVGLWTLIPWRWLSNKTTYPPFL